MNNLLLPRAMPVTPNKQKPPGAEDCTNSGGKVPPVKRAEACGALINSGKLKGADIAWAFSNRCIARKALGEQDKALDDCNKAIDLDGKDAVAFQARGLILLDKGDNDRALADFDKPPRSARKTPRCFPIAAISCLRKARPTRRSTIISGSGHRRQERLGLCRARRRLAGQRRHGSRFGGLFQGDRSRPSQFLRDFQSRRRL